MIWFTYVGVVVTCAGTAPAILWVIDRLCELTRP
jgi:hypothetical protein